jgi:hypothetical protein
MICFTFSGLRTRYAMTNQPTMASMQDAKGCTRIKLAMFIADLLAHLLIAAGFPHLPDKVGPSGILLGQNHRTKWQTENTAPISLNIYRKTDGTGGWPWFGTLLILSAHATEYNITGSILGVP